MLYFLPVGRDLVEIIINQSFTDIKRWIFRTILDVRPKCKYIIIMVEAVIFPLKCTCLLPNEKAFSAFLKEVSDISTSDKNQS